MRTVKIGDAEYKAIKALAEKNGHLLQFLLTKAIQEYLRSQKESA